MNALLDRPPSASSRLAVVDRTGRAPGEAAFDAGALRALAKVVTESLGIRMPDAKLTMLHGRLQRRLRQLGLSTVNEYVALINDPVRGPQELVQFCDLATTNKTDFFREPEHFTHLVQTALPTLAKRHRGAGWTCRLWCAGCSTGEEVYTLAMVLSEYAAQSPGFDFEIWATDISTRVLRHAAEATYAASLIEPVPVPLRKRYLLKSRDAEAQLVRMSASIRRKVRFERLNFMDPAYPAPHTFDVVFFRNVLIYFDRPTQEAVVRKQCQHLSAGGFLYISHTESLSGLDVPIETAGKSVFRRLA